MVDRIEAGAGGPVALEAEEAIRAIRRALGRSRRSEWPPDTVLPAQSAVSRLPAWVERFAALRRQSRTWLWCETVPGAVAEPYSQATLDLPPGRYCVRVFDAAARAWVSRESAEGGPLVLSLPCGGAPVLALVRSVSGGNGRRRALESSGIVSISGRFASSSSTSAGASPGAWSFYI